MDTEATPVWHQVLEFDPENTPARLHLLSFAIREQNIGSGSHIVCSSFRIYSGCLGILLLYGIGLSSDWENRRGIGGLHTQEWPRVTDPMPRDLVPDSYAIIGDLYPGSKIIVEAYAADDSALVYKDSHMGAWTSCAY